jgi:hypothetical protein
MRPSPLQGGAVSSADCTGSPGFVVISPSPATSVPRTASYLEKLWKQEWIIGKKSKRNASLVEIEGRQ